MSKNIAQTSNEVQLKKSNAERFIMAYNKIDYSLRTIYGFKRSISYADLIRKSVTLNSVVRKYEEEMVDYGRLRNSIVHRTNPNYVIAEPHEDVVQEFEKIARLISTPPNIIDKFCNKSVVIENGEASLKSIIELINTSGYNNIPIYAGTRLIGVATGQKLIRCIGQELAADHNIDEYLKNTKIKDVLPDETINRYFKVADKRLTIEKALNLFYLDRKLAVIILTDTGAYTEEPIGIITVSDILDLNEILENY